MLGTKTVFVLGAGASLPYGFPTGRELIALILSRYVTHLNGIFNRPPPQLIEDILSELKLLSLDKNFRKDLLLSNQPSVDAFLEYRRDFTELGKAYIALMLLPCEKGSQLIRNISEPPEWIELLWHNWRSPNPEDLINGNITFLTFNYDRSLEQILQRLFMANYGYSQEKAQGLVSKVAIYHVYGSLGGPDVTGSTNPIPYGAEITAETINQCIQNIAIITDSRNERISETKEKIASAEIISFLGFGYHPTNISLLFDDIDLSRKRLYGTGFGMLDGEIYAARQLFQKYFKTVNDLELRLKIVNIKSAELLRTFPVFR